MEDTVEVELHQVIMHDKGDQQYIHLRERDGDRSFPIVIGFNEVFEIQRRLRKQSPPRPMTHDLIRLVIQELGHRLARIVITELKDNTFYAVLVLAGETGGPEHKVDCRPSDAIALAVQTGAPIYVAKKVLDTVAPA